MPANKEEYEKVLQEWLESFLLYEPKHRIAILLRTLDRGKDLIEDYYPNRQKRDLLKMGLPNTKGLFDQRNNALEDFDKMIITLLQVCDKEI